MSDELTEKMIVDGIRRVSLCELCALCGKHHRYIILHRSAGRLGLWAEIATEITEDTEKNDER